MSNELYTVLGVTTEATTEEIRKAYKRRALETHPDRHPGQDKTIAEENFRKVNNAYEVLSDPEKRRIYDAEGVWPPRGDMHESSDGNRRPNGWPTDNNPFPNFSPFGGFGHDPFFSAFGPSRSPFGFSDPFDIFAAVFGDRHLNGLRGFGSPFAAADPFGGHPGSPFSDPFFTGSSSRARDPFGRMFGPMFPHSLLMDDMLGGRQGNGGMKTMSFSSSIAGQSNGSGPRWVSESRSMRTVNGVTETVVQKKDSEGNVHVERTYPDGRKTLTINGVEQATITNGSPNPPPAPIEYTRPDRSYGNPPTVGYADPARANYANDPSYHSSSAYYHRPRYEEPSYPATGQNLNNTYQQGQPYAPPPPPAPQPTYAEPTMPPGEYTHATGRHEGRAEERKSPDKHRRKHSLFHRHHQDHHQDHHPEEHPPDTHSSHRRHRLWPF